MTFARKRALILLFPGVEEIEAVTPIDLLRRANVDVTTVSIDDSSVVTGRSGLTFHADTTLASVTAQVFDVLVIPGGPGVKHLRASPEVLELARRHHAAGRLTAAICAAPTVLADAGILDGVHHTAHFSVADELPDLDAGVDVARDGNILTSRGAGTALAFSLALITALHSQVIADEVAAAICLRKPQE